MRFPLASRTTGGDRDGDDHDEVHYTCGNELTAEEVLAQAFETLEVAREALRRVRRA